MSETVKEVSVSDRNDSTAREDDRERKRCVVAADQFKADGTQLFPAGDRCAVFIECLIFFFRIIIFQNMSIHMERGKCRKRKLRNAECIKGTAAEQMVHKQFYFGYRNRNHKYLLSESGHIQDFGDMVRVFFSIAEKTEKEKKKSIAKYVICVIVECSIKNQIT